MLTALRAGQVPVVRIDSWPVALEEDPPRASCARWIRDDAGLGILAHLAEHVRSSMSPRWRQQLGMAVLAEVEGGYLARYQSFVFNRTNDPFFEELESTLVHLADVTLEFFDLQLARFDVEDRIFQVVRDLSGVLQHYGVLGTPGLDPPTTSTWRCGSPPTGSRAAATTSLRACR